MKMTVHNRKPGVSPVWLIAGVALAVVAAWGVTSSLQRKPAPARTSVTVPAEVPADEPSAPPVTEAPSETEPRQGMGGVG